MSFQSKRQEVQIFVYKCRLSEKEILKYSSQKNICYFPAQFVADKTHTGVTRSVLCICVCFPSGSAVRGWTNCQLSASSTSWTQHEPCVFICSRLGIFSLFSSSVDPQLVLQWFLSSAPPPPPPPSSLPPHPDPSTSNPPPVASGTPERQRGSGSCYHPLSCSGRIKLLRLMYSSLSWWQFKLRLKIALGK